MASPWCCALRGTRFFLPAEEEAAAPSSSGSAWLEPRTLAIGVMVLAFTVAEGAANDWLSLALIDGYDVAHWVGVTGYVAFVCAMTVGRVTGPVVLDRFGRAPVLWGSSALAAAGTLLVILGGNLVVVGLGILVWGLGASLGFPVGMSAAADDPARSAARVSVVSTIGYGAFLGRPPAARLPRRPDRHPRGAVRGDAADGPGRAHRVRGPADPSRSMSRSASCGAYPFASLSK